MNAPGSHGEQPPTSDGFSALLDRSAFFAHERQFFLAEILEGRSGPYRACGCYERWDSDTDTGTVTFTFPSPELHALAGGTADALQAFGAAYGAVGPSMVCEAQVLGSAAPGPASWLWSWANSTVNPAATTLAQSLRKVGERDGIPELTTPEIPLGPAGNEPPDAFWYRLVVAVAGLTPSWDGYFRAPIGGGTVAPFIVRHPDVVMPEPSLHSVTRTLTEGISTGYVTDHRAAVDGYTRLRAIPTRWERNGCTLTLPDGFLTVETDHHGRICAMQSTVRPR